MGNDIMVKVVLFTGAGANYSLGLPITQVLLEKIKNGHYKFDNPYNEFFTTITQETDVKDIEHIWSILEKLEKTNDINKNFKFFGNYSKMQIFGKNLNWSDIYKRVRVLKEKIEDILFREYTLPIEKEHPAYEYYSAVINYLLTINEEKNLTKIPIFTTNYDRVLDVVGYKYEEEKNVNIIDGFGGSRLRPTVWNRTNYNKFLNRSNLIIYKLHGSLSWKISSDKKIENVLIESPSRNHITHPSSLLIYPGEEKEPKNEPFKTIHNHLINYLEKAKLCISIGFAFRDSYIRKIFIKAMANNPELKLAIVTPNAANNFDENPLVMEIKRHRKIKIERVKPFSSHFEKLGYDKYESIGSFAKL
jgi:hypothetical protein